jgi:hypothetical protein
MSHTYRSNAEEIGRRLVEQIRSFGFRTTHEGKALGELIVDNIIDGIQVRSTETQSAPSTGPWPVNSDNPPGQGYRSRKRRQYGTDLTNIRTGQMLSADSLRGKTTIEDRLVKMEYGTNLVMEGSALSDRRTSTKTSVGDFRYDVTDVDKATYANEQHRSFFELDQEIMDANFQRVNDALAAHLANPGR